VWVNESIPLLLFPSPIFSIQPKFKPDMVAYIIGLEREFAALFDFHSLYCILKLNPSNLDVHLNWYSLLQWTLCHYLSFISKLRLTLGDSCGLRNWPLGTQKRRFFLFTISLYYCSIMKIILNWLTWLLSSLLQISISSKNNSTNFLKYGLSTSFIKAWNMRVCG